MIDERVGAAAPGMPVVTIEPLYPDVVLPTRASVGAAGYDLRAYLTGSDPRLSGGGASRLVRSASGAPCLLLAPGDRALVPLGFRAAVPPGYEAQVRPRSGLAFRVGLELPNAPGTIDSDFRGEWQVLLKNGSSRDIEIEHGERIAQVVFAAVVCPALATGAVDPTPRAEGGFGSTGRR